MNEAGLFLGFQECILGFQEYILGSQEYILGLQEYILMVCLPMQTLK